MNFDEAKQKHAEWRFKFKTAIVKKETLDAEAIAKDDRCDLGKWLHGDAKIKYAKLPGYAECLKRHAQFHIEASKVAKAINARKFDEAQTMLGMGSGFSSASGAIGAALDELEKEARK